MMETMEKNKNPEHNKLRIVYSVDSNGNPISYKHIDHDETLKVLKLAEFISKTTGWIPRLKVSKSTKIKRSTLERIIRLMVGMKWADMKENGKYIKIIPGEVIHIKNSMYNKKRNVPNVKIPYRPVDYIRRAGV